MVARAKITLKGVVQGVGFRPYVYTLAESLQLRGYVTNTSEGVTIDIEGEQLAEFIARLPKDSPPLSKITSVSITPLPEYGYGDFRIIESREDNSQVPFTLISPDISICDECLKELMDPRDRRYLYPFINCTNCGPRFTIMRDVPYDRPRTSMSPFPMCDNCRAEYEDPQNRRFHAQPNACWKCGPHLNFWDAQGHEMAHSNDPATRKEIFEWIEKNEKTFYLPRIPMHPVGVYFSPKSRDYDPKGFLQSYRGAMVALIQAHRELQVVTPRTLDEFHGACLVLPDVSVLSASETKSLRQLVDHGGRLVILGTEATGVTRSSNVSVLSPDPASAFYAALMHDFAASAHPPMEFLNAVAVKPEIELQAPPSVAANFGRVNGSPHVFLANFGGLVPNKVAVPEPAKGLTVKAPANLGDTLTFLPFLGEAQVVPGKKQNGQMEFPLPPVERGAVVWLGLK